MSKIYIYLLFILFSLASKCEAVKIDSYSITDGYLNNDSVFLLTCSESVDTHRLLGQGGWRDVKKLTIKTLRLPISSNTEQYIVESYFSTSDTSLMKGSTPKSINNNSFYRYVENKVFIVKDNQVQWLENLTGKQFILSNKKSEAILCQDGTPVVFNFSTQATAPISIPKDWLNICEQKVLNSEESIHFDDTNSMIQVKIEPSLLIFKILNNDRSTKTIATQSSEIQFRKYNHFYKIDGIYTFFIWGINKDQNELLYINEKGEIISRTSANGLMFFDKSSPKVAIWPRNHGVITKGESIILKIWDPVSGNQFDRTLHSDNIIDIMNQ